MSDVADKVVDNVRENFSHKNAFGLRRIRARGPQELSAQPDDGGRGVPREGLSEFFLAQKVSFLAQFWGTECFVWLPFYIIKSPQQDCDASGPIHTIFGIRRPPWRCRQQLQQLLPR